MSNQITPLTALEATRQLFAVFRPPGHTEESTTVAMRVYLRHLATIDVSVLAETVDWIVANRRERWLPPVAEVLRIADCIARDRRDEITSPELTAQRAATRERVEQALAVPRAQGLTLPNGVGGWRPELEE